MIYTRLGAGLQAEQIHPTTQPTADYCWVKVNGVTFAGVYKAPNSPEAAGPLLEWNPPVDAVVAGDFNAVHPRWQPGAARYHGKGQEIVEWADEHGLQCLIRGVATHNAGNTLDLVWPDNLRTVAWVAHEECVTSDHLPIRGTVFPPPPASGQSTLNTTDDRPIRVRDSDLPRFAKAMSMWTPLVGPLDCEEHVDQLAREIVRAVKEAISISGSRRRPPRGCAAPWWTEECRQAREDYASSNPEERPQARKELRSQVLKAKREHWKRMVEEMETQKDVFRLVKWADARSRQPPPPLLHEDRLVTDQRERATILGSALLTRFSAADDLPPPEEPHPPGSLNWVQTISEDEVRECTIGGKTTAPGEDGLTVRLMKACWDSIGPHVTRLFQACVSIGSHPAAFKNGEIVLVPKKGRDPATSRAWRPIALLSCLGKGLERLLAKRLAHTALVEGVVSDQHFGPAPGRSATDLVGCLVHDVEKALDRRRTATLVTVDVKGAFDGVLHNRLLRRMQAQGWPPQLLKWTASFLSGRSAQIRYPGGVTEPIPLACGVPQGSPASPVLFMLYLAEGLQKGSRRCRFGYADDIALLGFGATKAEGEGSCRRCCSHSIQVYERSCWTEEQKQESSRRLKSSLFSSPQVGLYASGPIVCLRPQPETRL